MNSHIGSILLALVSVSALALFAMSQRETRRLDLASPNFQDPCATLQNLSIPSLDEIIESREYARKGNLLENL